VLSLPVDCEVRKVAAAIEISDRTGDANKLVLLPCRHDKISMAKHTVNAVWILNRPALGKRRAAENIDELIR
jgi:hypothetical protein